MTDAEPNTPATEDETAILSLIDCWTRAVREEDRAAIRRDHDSEMLMFDVPPPLLSRGLDAYMATWEMFFANVEKPVAFEMDDVKVTRGADVAFATAPEGAWTVRAVAANRSNSG
jgi:ketosteroid isomerase-like protein